MGEGRACIWVAAQIIGYRSGENGVDGLESESQQGLKGESLAWLLVREEVGMQGIICKGEASGRVGDNSGNSVVGVL